MNQEVVNKDHIHTYKYIKKRRENDEEFRAKLNNKARECMNKKYSEDEEYRKKKTEYNKMHYQKVKAQLEELKKLKNSQVQQTETN